MHLTKTNKTLIACLVFIFGIAATLLNSVLYFAVIFTLLIIYFLWNKVISYKFALACSCVLLFSVFYTGYREVNSDDLSKIVPLNADLRGRVVTQLKEDRNKAKFQLEAYSLKIKNQDWKQIKAKVLVTVLDKERKFKDVSAGDIIEISGNIKLPYKATNPGQFDYRKYLQNSGIFTVVFVKSNDYKLIEHPKSGKWFFIQELTKLKNKIMDVHKGNLKSPKIEVLGGVVFGDYAVPAPKDVKQNFIGAGLLHLLAASGMNVAIIFGIWAFLSRRFLPYKLHIIIGAVLVLFYGALTGMPPSVVRATWMIEFMLFGKLIDRRADTVALLALVCAIMLLVSPMLITDIGFQLSFIVTFGLLACMPVLAEKTKAIPDIVAGAVLIPIVAQIWAAPLQLFHFNNFATYSVLANILVLPSITVISFLGFISSIFGLIPLIGTNICWILDKIDEPFISFLLYVSKSISLLPGALQYFPTPKIIAVILFYILILLITLHIKTDFSKKWLNYVILAIVLMIITVSCKDCFTRELKILVFDVGEADSILIQTPDKNNMLVDTAGIGIGDFKPVNITVIPYLRDKGINELNSVLLTHPDSDHIGGTIDLLKAVKVDKIYDNGEKSKSKTYKRIESYIHSNKITDISLKGESTINLEKDLKIDVIKPPNTNKKSHNDTSLVLYIRYKDFSALLMGDAESESLPEIKKYVHHPVDIIQIGHHGSGKSVNNDFIKYLTPQLAVISVGKNSYSHPSPKALKILDKFGIKTLRTDQNEAVEIDTNGMQTTYRSYNNPLKLFTIKE